MIITKNRTTDNFNFHTDWAFRINYNNKHKRKIAYLHAGTDFSASPDNKLWNLSGHGLQFFWEKASGIKGSVCTILPREPNKDLQFILYLFHTKRNSESEGWLPISDMYELPEISDLGGVPPHLHAELVVNRELYDAIDEKMSFGEEYDPVEKIREVCEEIDDDPTPHIRGVRKQIKSWKIGDIRHHSFTRPIEIIKRPERSSQHIYYPSFEGKIAFWIPVSKLKTIKELLL